MTHIKLTKEKEKDYEKLRKVFLKTWSNPKSSREEKDRAADSLFDFIDKYRKQFNSDP